MEKNTRVTCRYIYLWIIGKKLEFPFVDYSTFPGSFLWLFDFCNLLNSNLIDYLIRFTIPVDWMSPLSNEFVINFETITCVVRIFHCWRILSVKANAELYISRHIRTQGVTPFPLPLSIVSINIIMRALLPIHRCTTRITVNHSKYRVNTNT